MKELNTKSTFKKALIITLNDCNKVGEQWANQMDGIKFFSTKRCHLSLKSLADLFLIVMYRSIITFSRNCKLNKEKSKGPSAKLRLYMKNLAIRSAKLSTC